MKLVVQAFILNFLFFSIVHADQVSADDYTVRYGVKDVFTKIVDNHGEGESRLYGVRNARILFRNVLRGGANNVYLREHPRENQNPLPMDGLMNLCKEGFTDAIYLYQRNYETAPRRVECVRNDGTPGSLNYHNLIFNRDETTILSMVKEKLELQQGGLYLHCWNGWHASGYVSAISLIQFCGVSANDAVDYWNRNTDGVNQGENYERIRQKIRAFKPNAELNIDPLIKARVCVELK